MSLPASLMVITNRGMVAGPLPLMARRLFEAGCRWLLVREKDLPPVELEELVRKIVAFARPHGAVVGVSAQAEIAVRCGAGAVHLPWGSSVADVRTIARQDLLVGMSTHGRSEAEAALSAGVDYITLSPIFPTASKPGYGPALGLEVLHRLATALPIPVVALGGITSNNASDCLQAGAAAVAVMGTVMRAHEPERVLRQLLGTGSTERSER